MNRKLEVISNRSTGKHLIQDTHTGEKLGYAYLTPRGYRIKIHQIKNTYTVLSYLSLRGLFGVKYPKFISPEN